MLSTGTTEWPGCHRPKLSPRRTRKNTIALNGMRARIFLYSSPYRSGNHESWTILLYFPRGTRTSRLKTLLRCSDRKNLSHAEFLRPAVNH
jgi:hypothetical protein